MKAKKKQLDVVKPEALGVDVTPRLKTLKVAEPPKRKGGALVKSVDELVDKLKNEAKVIPERAGVNGIVPAQAGIQRSCLFDLDSGEI